MVRVDAICGLSLLLVLSFVPRGFSPGTPVFSSPQKATFPNSNSIWNARTRFNKFFSTPKCFVGKQITLEITSSSSYNHVCFIESAADRLLSTPSSDPSSSLNTTTSAEGNERTEPEAVKDSLAQVSVKSEENTQLHPTPTENGSEHNVSSVGGCY